MLKTLVEDLDKTGATLEISPLKSLACHATASVSASSAQYLLPLCHLDAECETRLNFVNWQAQWQCDRQTDPTLFMFRDEA
jgi:hypothetical protein